MGMLGWAVRGFVRKSWIDDLKSRAKNLEDEYTRLKENATSSDAASKMTKITAKLELLRELIEELEMEDAADVDD